VVRGRITIKAHRTPSSEHPFNRIDLRFAESLRQAIHEASQTDIRVLVFKAEGSNFSFDSDVRE
jgi:enoyl-CoA hydratase/carnithine racemase